LLSFFGGPGQARMLPLSPQAHHDESSPAQHMALPHHAERYPPCLTVSLRIS